MVVPLFSTKDRLGGSGPPREAAGVPAGRPRQASSSVRRFEVAGFFFFLSLMANLVVVWIARKINK